jgi:hypothetical protein
MHLIRKKQFRAAVLLGLALLICRLPAARASGQLPADIRAQFGGIEITDSAYWDSPGSTWFVLIRTPDRVNRLLCYTLESGTWTQQFQTSAAVPQGDGRVRILFSDQIKEITGSGTVIKPVLTVLQYGIGPDEPSMQLQLEFMRSASGIWNLFRAVFSDEQMCLDIDEDIVAFRPAAEPDSDRLQTVTVTLERDLRHMNLAEIPKTPEQAQP